MEIKKKRRFEDFIYYIILVLISFLPLASFYITSDLLHTHDGLVHLARIGAYFKALRDGQFPVRFAGDLNYGYGMPLFNFIYPLPYLIASVFVFLGFGLVDAFKLTLVLSYLLSGVFMFAFAKEFLSDIKKGFLVAIFYQFASFRIIEILTRGALGETYAYSFFPLALLGLTCLFKKQTIRNFLIASLGTAFLILSHNSVSLIFFALSFGFILFFAKNKKEFAVGLGALVFGLLLSAFYFLPALLEHKYTYGDLFMKKLYLVNFPPFQNLLAPNLINSPLFWVGKVPVQIGLFQILAVISSIIVIFFRKIDFTAKKLIIFCILIFIIALFFMHPTSKILWERISFLRQFQFPWRFLSAVVFSTSLLSVSFFSFNFFKKTPIYYLAVAFVIISSIFYWIPKESFDKINENYYWNFPLNTTYYGEADVIWSAGPAKSYPKQRVEIISGNAQIKKFNKKSNLHTFQVDAKTSAVIIDHTQYFPGWRVYIDAAPAAIEFQDINHRGEIEFSIPRGKHNVRVIFEETRIRFLADILSILALLLIVFISFKSISLRLLKK